MKQKPWDLRILFEYIHTQRYEYVVVRMMMIKLSGLQVRIIVNSRLHFTSSFPVSLIGCYYTAYIHILNTCCIGFWRMQNVSFRLRLECVKSVGTRSACVMYVWLFVSQTTENHFI